MQGVDGVESFGIVRRLGPEGKITLPKSLRKRFKIEHNDGLEIAIEGNYIIMSKYRPRCVFCGANNCITEYKSKHLCEECVTALGSQAR